MFVPQPRAAPADPKARARRDQRDAFFAATVLAMSFFALFLVLLSTRGLHALHALLTLTPALAYTMAVLANFQRRSTLYIPGVLLTLLFAAFGYCSLLMTVVAEAWWLWEAWSGRGRGPFAHLDPVLMLGALVMLDLLVLVALQLLVWIFRVMKRDYDVVLDEERLRAWADRVAPPQVKVFSLPPV